MHIGEKRKIVYIMVFISTFRLSTKIKIAYIIFAEYVKHIVAKAIVSKTPAITAVLAIWFVLVYHSGKRRGSYAENKPK